MRITEITRNVRVSTGANLQIKALWAFMQSSFVDGKIPVGLCLKTTECNEVDDHIMKHENRE
jgi:hypothetical protein